LNLSGYSFSEEERGQERSTKAALVHHDE